MTVSQYDSISDSLLLGVVLGDEYLFLMYFLIIIKGVMWIPFILYFLFNTYDFTYAEIKWGEFTKLYVMKFDLVFLSVYIY